MITLCMKQGQTHGNVQSNTLGPRSGILYQKTYKILQHKTNLNLKVKTMPDRDILQDVLISHIDFFIFIFTILLNYHFASRC